MLSGGERRPACPSTLFRRVGPHTPDCSPRQDLVGPLLQDTRGESLLSLATEEDFECTKYSHRFTHQGQFTGLGYNDCRWEKVVKILQFLQNELLSGTN